MIFTAEFIILLDLRCKTVVDTWYGNYGSGVGSGGLQWGVPLLVLLACLEVLPFNRLLPEFSKFPNIQEIPVGLPFIPKQRFMSHSKGRILVLPKPFFFLIYWLSLAGVSSSGLQSLPNPCLQLCLSPKL